MSGPRARVAVVTGTRAEFGLLAPVMRAIAASPELELLVVVAGAHLLPPALTVAEVREAFDIAAEVPMQAPGDRTRLDDARALGRGVAGFADAFARLQPDWVVVLGDRIEAFAAGAAASVGGIPVAHLHGGDRAEGVADEAMRHALTKLAHLHLAATKQSAERIVRMGEDPAGVHIVGSPAIDGLDAMPALDDETARGLGDPDTIFLMHPIGDSEEVERARAGVILAGLRGRRVLALHPNHDPGRAGVVAAIRDAGAPEGHHLPRAQFVGLLRRLAARGGVLVGNSSAGLIEAAAVRLPAVDVGSRESGRERPGNTVWTPGASVDEVRDAVRSALAIDRATITHPYGDGRAGERIAALLAEVSPDRRRALLRKRCSY